MMRMFGQEDKELAESIQREEELAKFFFKESAPEPELVVESSTINEVIVPTPEPAPAFTPPTTNTVVDVVNVLKSANVANANTNVYRDKEMEGMRKTIAEMMQKISTLSWGGGGTGIVRVFDADDFDRNTVGEGKFMKFSNGWFVLETVNPGAQGPQGSQGAVGAQGSQGLQGAQGFQGVQGASGSQGAVGAQGSQGLQGAQGFQGVQGAQGSQGFQGVQGASGSQGVYSTTIVTSNTYVVANSDYYIGVNNASYTTITLPSTPVSGRMVIIKDESGNAQLYPIKLDGNVDNDPGGAEIRINNGGVQLIYRNGWRIV